MCVQVTKTANRFEISSLLEKILLKQVRWCLTFVGLYTCLLNFLARYMHFNTNVAGYFNCFSEWISFRMIKRTFNYLLIY